jgi:ATP-binding cassette subfamily F protein 3
VNFTIERGDRVALVGQNGAGKSTLIRLLTGVESPTSGTVQLGHNVIPEYFAQDQYKVLDPEARMLDDISRAAIKVPEVELRSLLGCFLFSGDDVFKPLGVLSGGERNRYAWRGFWFRHRISCCSTSRPTISICAPRMCCWRRSSPSLGQ